jgi:gas vesicle protein
MKERMMKKVAWFIIISLFLSSLVYAADYGTIMKNKHRYYLNCKKDFHIDLQGSSVIINQKYGEISRVEIMKDGNLIIDGQPVKTNHHQKKLLRNYNRTFRNMMEAVQAIEKKAVKLGQEGVEVGVSAVSGVLASLWSETELDELKEKLEEKADRLEEKADALEEEAQEIEEYVEELEEIHETMAEEIPELHNLKWY